MVDICLLSARHPHTLTILWTGRVPELTKYIKQLTESNGMFFDQVIPLPENYEKPNPNAIIESLDFLLQKHTKVKVVNFFGEIESARQFNTQLKEEIKTRWNLYRACSYKIKEGFSQLPGHSERVLVQQLINQFRMGISLYTDRVRYTAVVLNQESRHILLSLFQPPDPHWRVYADHMTICLGRPPPHLQSTLRPLLNQTVSLQVIGCGQSSVAMALRIGGDYQTLTTNRVAHITMFIAPGCKPHQSNDIRKWWPLPDWQRGMPRSLHVTGVLQLVSVWKIQATSS
eukprot:Lithocolla_globosa_v1_NODE_1665_length_2411_cov_2.416384.p1 type:complete len:286 gc:universal NODE_1665_length_2411_cov_2.416384:1303-2160(+)